MSKQIKIPKLIINGINNNYSKSQQSATDAIKYAIKVGEGLIKAKEKVPHGEWENWLKVTFKVTFASKMQASRYMKLAKNKQLALAKNSGSINETLKAISEATPEEIEEAENNPADDKAPQPHISNNSGNNHWYTPEKFIFAAREVMGDIDLDPASSEQANKVVKAEMFYDENTNGLNKEWFGKVWMNPPYAQPLMNQFAEKLVKSLPDIDVAIILVNNATETQWFQSMAKDCNSVCFPSKRIKFIDKEGNEGGSPLQGQAFLYFGSDTDLFNHVFSEFGFVL